MRSLQCRVSGIARDHRWGGWSGDSVWTMIPLSFCSVLCGEARLFCAYVRTWEVKINQMGCNRGNTRKIAVEWALTHDGQQ